MTITIKMNTQAAKVDANGKFDSNIRPNVYVADTVAEVVKIGIAPNNGRPYTWYIVKYGVYSHSFVTTQDVR